MTDLANIASPTSRSGNAADNSRGRIDQTDQRAGRLLECCRDAARTSRSIGQMVQLLSERLRDRLTACHSLDQRSNGMLRGHCLRRHAGMLTREILRGLASRCRRTGDSL
jgi:hypothetical protein